MDDIFNILEKDGRLSTTHSFINSRYYGPPSLDDPDLIDEIEHDRLKRELSHLSINGYSKPIATPHTGQLILKCPLVSSNLPKCQQNIS